MLEIKNVSGSDIDIDNLVQTDVNTPHADDGVILDGQTLDILKSFTICEMHQNEDIAELIKIGDIVFVVNSIEYTAQQSYDYYELGTLVMTMTQESTARIYMRDMPEFRQLIVDTLQSLTGEDRLDASAIKNLP